MDGFMQFLGKTLGDQNTFEMVLRLVGSLCVLIIGWIVAIAISKAVSIAVRRLSLEQRFAACLPEEEAGKTKKVESAIASASYYLVLLITLLAFLSSLGLTTAAAPINELVSKIMAFIPNVIGAAALLAIAWIVATALRFLTARGMSALKVDEKLCTQLDEPKGTLKLSGAVAEAVYWLAFLLFIPPVLNSLNMKGLLEPFQAMFSKVFEYLPHIVAAVAILAIGWFLAAVLRKVVTSVLVAGGCDQLGKRAGLGPVFGSLGLSKACGLVVYVMVFIPVVITALSALKIDALANPLGKLLEKILGATGNIFGAAVLIFAAYIAGHIASKLVTQLLEGFGFNKLLNALGIAKDPSAPAFSPAAVVGKLVHVAIMFFAAIACCDMLGFNDVGELLARFMPFAGKIVLGVIIFMVGLYLAKLALESLRGKGIQSELISTIARIAILAFTGAMALSCMGLASEIIQTAFSLILGAVAVAVAIAFGLGGRKFAARKLEEWNETLAREAKRRDEP